MPLILPAHEIDLLIKNGHVYVFDPKNAIDTVMDIDIAKGKIFKHLHTPERCSASGYLKSGKVCIVGRLGKLERRIRS